MTSACIAWTVIITSCCKVFLGPLDGDVTYSSTLFSLNILIVLHGARRTGETEMKRMYSMLIMLVTGIVALGLAACSNDEDGQLAKNEVKVCFIYTLDTSNGNPMTRATSNEVVFNEFYEKIKTGELVAPTYDLTLTEVNTGASYNFKGSWASHDLITLRTGTYHVVGTSKAEGDNVQEKCSFTFDEQIDISITSSTVTLHANYDCSLLIFNNADIKSLQNYNGESLAPFFTFKTYRYAFVNGQLYLDNKRSDAYILGQYTSNAEFKVFTGYLSFEKGKYYVYNSVSNGFDVPPMEEGTEKNREIEGFGRVADAVDLGLSVKWASWNVGASKIADYGGLYGAGDPTGLLLSTSNASYYWKKGISISGTEYDLAYVKWGGSWRIPSYEELIELKNNCTWEHNVTNEGVKGSIAKGPSGNSIFFPYSGTRFGGELIERDEVCCIWSADSHPGYGALSQPGYYDLDIRSGRFQTDGSECFPGQSIRPVCNK